MQNSDSSSDSSVFGDGEQESGQPYLETMAAHEIKCSDPDRCARGCMYSRCKAGSDGECNWTDCPQLIAHQGHCPLDICSWDIAALRSENARLQQERDDYRADYIRVHKEKCDLLYPESVAPDQDTGGDDR